MTIQARDMGSPSLASARNARVTVDVARNNNPPKFEGAPYTAAIKRDAQTGALVKQVLARDADLKVGPFIW